MQFVCSCFRSCQLIILYISKANLSVWLQALSTGSLRWGRSEKISAQKNLSLFPRYPAMTYILRNSEYFSILWEIVNIFSHSPSLYDSWFYRLLLCQPLVWHCTKVTVTVCHVLQHPCPFSSSPWNSVASYNWSTTALIKLNYLWKGSHSLGRFLEWSLRKGLHLSL